MKVFLFIVVAVVIGVAMYFLLSRGIVSPPSPGATSSTGGISGPPTGGPGSISGDTITFGTPQGGVRVKNFYKNPVRRNKEGDATIKETSDYEIDYGALDSSFAITFIVPPTKASLLAAEDNFLSSLGVTREDACKLNASWGVLGSVSPVLAGNHYKLTFCPGAQTPALP